jgi:hypothetical protein
MILVVLGPIGLPVFLSAMLFVMVLTLATLGAFNDFFTATTGRSKASFLRMATLYDFFALFSGSGILLPDGITMMV